ncbi:MAG: hypothetical protein UV63_C0038G0005 [Microgenomates group bacterium GW2011_GWC1_43_11]|nr:MAG: hypothetical protein UV63_C0038G0005 [Microgenomates group bacterium GW2011_GWC1_43_11]
MKKDEGGQKGASPSRGRIMQVVEVEEDDTSKQKVDIQAPAEIVKEKESSSAVPSGTIGDKEEKPDIASSFPMQSKDTAEKTITDNHEETPPLKTEEKRDIVSELFETKETKVQYPNISIDRKPSKFGFRIFPLTENPQNSVLFFGLLSYLQLSDLSAGDFFISNSGLLPAGQ